jgi:hypothetical protein
MITIEAVQDASLTIEYPRFIECEALSTCPMTSEVPPDSRTSWVVCGRGREPTLSDLDADNIASAEKPHFALDCGPPVHALASALPSAHCSHLDLLEFTAQVDSKGPSTSSSVVANTTRSGPSVDRCLRRQPGDPRNQPQHGGGPDHVGAELTRTCGLHHAQCACCPKYDQHRGDEDQLSCLDAQIEH